MNNSLRNVTMRRGCSSARRRGFSLIELSISMAIVTVIILCVGVVFQSASSAVGTSQALLDETDSIEAIGHLLRRDIAGMDKRAFLTIRSRMLDAHNPASPRFDQMAFLAYGSFPDRTGSADSNHPFLDNTLANAAHIWWGQLIVERYNPPDPSYVNLDLQIPAQQYSGPPTQSNVMGGRGRPQPGLPTGVYYDGHQGILNENECVLGRHATLLLPGPSVNGYIAPAGYVLRAYDGINSRGIESSRFDVAAVLPEQIRNIGLGGVTTCFRFHVPYSPYDIQVPDQTFNGNDQTVRESPFVTAAFRMYPIVLAGVSSLKIDWTNGTLDAHGQLAWYGPTNFKGDNRIESIFPDDPASPDRDHYQAGFSGDDQSLWPRALRVTYHLVDPNHRLQGGRDIVEMISLPD